MPSLIQSLYRRGEELNEVQGLVILPTIRTNYGRPVDQGEVADNSPTVLGKIRRRITKELQKSPRYEEEDASFWLDD